jgi:hypothetical protein
MRFFNEQELILKLKNPFVDASLPVKIQIIIDSEVAIHQFKNNSLL